MSIPKISQVLIHARASNKSWQRGEAYYRDGAVMRVVQRGNSIGAEVQGNDIKPYRVSISFDGEKIETAYCNCPYDYGDWCKHIVATLLVCLRSPETIEVGSSLEQILDRLNEIQTQNLIQELVANRPELIEDIEYFADRVAPVAIFQESPKTKPQRQITVNVNSIRSQVRNILTDAIRHLEYGGEEDIATEEICNLIEDARSYLQRGDNWNAIAIAKAITSTCVENWDIVDDFGIDNGDVATKLSNIWCETILTKDISEAEKVDLQVNLEFWRNDWGSYFDLPLAALEQGWDYPPLKQVLQGNITPLGVSTEEAPDYADDLALIRLQILERQKRFQEYLYLAAAEGQTTKYLTMLARLGRVDEAMAASKQQMTTIEQALALSKALVNEENARSEALEIAKKGLSLPGSCQYDLATWTCEIALLLDDRVLATIAKVKAFQAQPSFRDYRQVEQLAADNWLNIKNELLASLAKSTSWGTKEAQVDIYLYEGLIDKAIATANNLPYYQNQLIQRVMDAAINVNPDWVISNACRRAESIVDEGKAKYYEAAVEWLKKARNAYIASARQQEWSDYRAKLIATYARKRKLMGLMKSVV